MLGGLVALWIAARVGYRRRVAKWKRAGSPIAPKPDPFQPGLEEVGALMLVLGIVGCTFGVAQLLSEEYSRSTRGWWWVWNAAYDSFGTAGVAAIWLGGGGMLIAMGMTALRR